ncbi:hypothetical protein [Polaribacter butkevichii]|uniref:DUF4369 domain-containing protein n=1 Tax=Polaribacter butkevichii TaxID=218490 RepID=A0A2P6CFF0_9FLAO|nr:hypothetical protein [Polaribacter butkevichii]PQJ73614.1 hypothetical protein BTO14_10195 [Polaribacter butkevichii]
MKKLTILITIILMAFTNYVDVGDPSIQAVCKITTENGETHVGFVTLINGSYNGMHANGFYLYQDEHYNWTTLFDFELHSLKRIGKTKYNIGNFSPDAKEIHFIAHTWGNDRYSSKDSKKVISDSIGKHLIKKTELIHQYRMFDSIPLFKELPRTYHLNYNETDSIAEKIAMNNIVSFEILKNPNSKWLEKIEQARKTYLNDNSGEDSTGDYLEPIWIHELIKKPKRFKELKDYFKSWKNK